MGLTRRSFLGGLIATPAIVQAGNIWIPPRKLVVPEPADFGYVGFKVWVIESTPRSDCDWVLAKWMGKERRGGFTGIALAT